MKLIRRFWILLIFYLFLCLACSKESNDWKTDLKYSWNIVGINIGMKEKEKIILTIDKIQLFQANYNQRSLSPNFENFKRKNPNFETHNSEFIYRFVKSASEDIESNVSNCKFDEKRKFYHVLLFDNELKRVGYFRVFPCLYAGTNYAKVIPQNNPAIFYSATLLSIINKALDVQKEKKKRGQVSS